MSLGAAWLLLGAPGPRAIAQLPPGRIQPSAPATSSTLAPGRPSLAAADLETMPAPSAAVARVRWTLAEAVAFALAHNPRLRAAAALVDRSLADEQIAFAPFLPQIDLLNRLAGTDSNLSPGAPGLTGSILSQGRGGHGFVQSELQVQWTLYDFGRTAGRYGRSAAQSQIARLRLSRACETIVFEARAAYWRGLQGRDGRIIGLEAVRRSEATLHDAESRRAGGVADRDDVLRSRVQVAAAREQLVLAEEAELAALAQMNNVLGRPAQLPLELADARSEPELRRSLAECVEAAVSGRPEVGVARQAVAAAEYQRTAAAAERMPRVYALASLGYVDGRHVEAGFQEGAGIHLNQPIYAGGRKRGEFRAAEAEVRQASAQSQTVFDAVTLEVTLAYRAVLAARDRVELSRPTIAEAEENLRLERVKYRNGDATPTDLVDAETALTQAQQRFFAALYEHRTALARLDYAIGAPAVPVLDTPRQPADNGPQSPAVGAGPS
jgi:outer membrane protein TolC